MPRPTFRIAQVAALLAASLAVAVPQGSALAQKRTDLVVGMQLEPPHLDPTAGAAAAIDEVTYANLFEGLTRIDAKGDVVPGLAEGWAVSEDGLLHTFRLKKDVTFHDGTAFDSADVRFSLDRARAPDSVNAQKGYFEAIQSVETPDPYTVVVRLSRPDGLFLFNLAQGDAAMVAPESADTNRRNPVGTGPFRFDRWIAGDRVVLTRNPSYRGDAPKLDKVTFRFVSDPAAQVASLLAGDVDTFPQFGTYEAIKQFVADQRFTVMVGTTEGETILAMNNARKPFDDLRVRRAMTHAIDRAALIEGVTFGHAMPIGSHFAPHRPGYVDLTGLHPHDKEKARALLAEAGYPNGFETTLVLPPPTYARRSGELIAAMLAEVGITARIETVEWAAWLESVFRGRNYDLTIVAHTEPLDIGIYGRDDYYFNYAGERFRAAAAELKTPIKDGRRREILQDLQRIVAEDAVNVFLFQLPLVTVQNKGVIGMWPNRPVQSNDVTGVHWR